MLLAASPLPRAVRAPDLHAALAARAGLLLDLDGTLRMGDRWTPGAERLLAAFSGRIVVLSNDSEHTPEELSRRFAEWGRPLPPDRFVLAGAVAMETLASESPRASVLWLGSDALARRAEAHGLRLTERDPEFVLVGRDRSISFHKLGLAVTAVARGARLVACNADLTHPGGDGRLTPETGMLAAAIRAGAGGAPCRFIGKPERRMFDIALARLGVPADAALMIGDNPDTDAAGAAAAGVPFLASEALAMLDGRRDADRRGVDAEPGASGAARGRLDLGPPGSA
jgi:HAD superfamily hydrolase (TIGR01450 family)